MCLAKQTGIQTGSICRSGIRFSNAHKPHQQNPSNNVIAVNNLTAVETWQDFVVLSWFKHRIRAHQSGTSDCATAHSTQGLQLGRTTSLKDTKKHCHERCIGAGLMCLWHHVEQPPRSHHKDTAQRQELSFYLTTLCLPRADLSTAPQPHCHPLPREAHSDALKRSSLPAWHTSEGSVLLHQHSHQGEALSAEARKKKKKRTTLIPKKQTQKSPYLASST